MKNFQILLKLKASKNASNPISQETMKISYGFT